MTPVVFPIGVVMNYVVNNTLSTSSRRGEPGDKTVNRDIIKPARSSRKTGKGFRGVHGSKRKADF
jgi:hypothetical protein